MASNTSGSKNQTTRHDGSLRTRTNSGHTTVKHSAVSNPVPGKGGKKGK